MVASPRFRQGTLCALVAGALFVLAWNWTPSRATPPATAGPIAAATVGGGLGDSAESQPAPRVYFQAPVSPRAGAVWAKLGTPVPMPFPNETPLSDFVNYVRESTRGPDFENGLSIYVDPIGLVEAEKTMDSPIQIDLAGLPLSKTLTLVLKQLGLTYTVDDDGLLVITSETIENAEPSSRILDELADLRKQITELKTAVATPTNRGGGTQ
jgi:hypothetical protein